MDVIFDENTEPTRPQAVQPQVRPRLTIEAGLMKILKLESMAQFNATLLIVTGLCVLAIVLIWVQSGGIRGLSSEQKRSAAWMQAGHVGKPPADFSALRR